MSKTKCPDCKGTGEQVEDYSICPEGLTVNCPTCKGTGEQVETLILGVESNLVFGGFSTTKEARKIPVDYRTLKSGSEIHIDQDGKAFVPNEHFPANWKYFQFLFAAANYPPPKQPTPEESETWRKVCLGLKLPASLFNDESPSLHVLTEIDDLQPIIVEDKK